MHKKAERKEKKQVSGYRVTLQLPSCCTGSLHKDELFPQALENSKI